MRARVPDHEGYAERDGVKIHYEVYGEGGPTVLLLPTWMLVHKRLWKAQLHYLARHCRVVTYDPAGNGLSDRPTGPEAYTQEAQVGYALEVLDATGTDRAITASLSKAAYTALDLAANHGDRVLASVFIGPTILPFGPVGGDNADRVDVFGPPPEGVGASHVPVGGSDPAEHWAKFNPGYWMEHHEDFLWFWAGVCFNEPYSTKTREDVVRWGLDTTPEVLVAEGMGWWATQPDEQTLEAWCERVSSPVRVIHGDKDAVSPLAVGERLAELTGGELLVVEGGGHVPLAREPVQVNLALRDLVERHRPSRGARRTWTRGRDRAKRVLYLSSPIGLGHARRDMAIARELRGQRPDVEIDWLTQHPVTAALEAAGERVHPASEWLVNESSHIEGKAAEHDLHCFQALRDMDEILVGNFHVFHDVVSEGHYDLVVGDESWDVDHFLHENPELKRFPFAWFTDFVGVLPMSDGSKGAGTAGPFGPPGRELHVAADFNAEMIEHVERFPYIRDRALFVGNPNDIVPERFGEGLPLIREWTEANYAFPGYVTGFDPIPDDDREALRAELGYRPDERVCIVTVGGSGVGGALLAQVVAAQEHARRLVPELRTVVVTGPRIDPASVSPAPGLEVHGYVPGLYRHLAVCDIAVVQGGLTTTMELTANRRPFLYFPLRHHFEQNIHVRHRLDRYGAGRCMDYGAETPESIAHAIADEIGRKVDYLPVETDGAARAAALLAELL
jgi:pimeloyl-ACP methyl ester carboxylesterase